MPRPADHSRLSAPDRTQTTPSADDATAPSGGMTAPPFGPPAEPDDIGTLGPYRVVKLLGHGGMGAVYVAVDIRLGRRLALKVMLPRFAEHKASQERFVREARAAAQVTHDNVVVVYEADVRDGVPYIAMPLLEGCSLDRYLKSKGNPTVSQVIRIGREAAAGLAAAHAKGLVHRDVKPANLWLEAPGGRVKVLDFGLAKPLDSSVELTKQGELIGTPAYMSPEQARAEAVDHRTDLFSLGATLYRLCAGRPPFEGATTIAVLTALATAEPTPLRELNPAVPVPLAELIHQLLAKNPAARPPSAEVVVARLRALSEGGQKPATNRPTATAPLPLPTSDLPVERPSRSVPLRRRKPSGRPWLWLAVGGAVAVLAAASVAVFLLTQNGDGTRVKETGPGGVTAPTTTPGVSPSADVDRDTALWVLSIGGAVMVSGRDDHLKDPADLPKGPFTLTAVSLAKTAVTDADLDRLKPCRGLTYLHLEGSGISDAGMATVAALPAIQELHMARTGVGDAGVAHFAGNRRLTALDLSGTKVMNAGLAHFADCRGLAFLYLQDTALTDDGLKHFAGCTGLVHLDLFNTGVADAGMAHLKGCTALQYADLGRTKVTDDTLVQLEGCRDLTGLDVRGTQVTAKGIAKFHAALPGCEIEHDGGTEKPKPTGDPDRAAAEWAIGLGGMVKVVGKEDTDLKALADLPKGRFTVKAVSLSKTAAADAGLVRLKECKGLIALDLDGTAVTDDGLVHLKDLKALNELDLSQTAVTDKGVAHLKGLTRLATLSLDGAAATDTALAHLKELPTLAILYLEGVGVTNAGLAHLKDMRGLKQLFLTHSSVTDDGLVHLKELKGLAVLSLGVAKVTDVGLAHLKGLTGLTYLDLDRTQVTDDGLANLKDMRGLDYLVLDGTGVTDAGLVHLTELNALKQLILSHTAVADDGLAHLKGLRALANLDLSNSKVSDTGLAHLKVLTGLKALDVRKSKVTAKGVDAFHTAVPGCEIEHEGGTTGPKK